jgi:hypothetical protein
MRDDVMELSRRVRGRWWIWPYHSQERRDEAILQIGRSGEQCPRSTVSREKSFSREANAQSGPPAAIGAFRREEHETNHRALAASELASCAAPRAQRVQECPVSHGFLRASRSGSSACEQRSLRAMAPIAPPMPDVRDDCEAPPSWARDNNTAVAATSLPLFLKKRSGIFRPSVERRKWIERPTNLVGTVDLPGHKGWGVRGSSRVFDAGVLQIQRLPTCIGNLAQNLSLVV